MTIDEYISRKQELKKEFDKQCRKLDVEFALSNNTIKTCDIIKDHANIGKVINSGIYIDTNKLPKIVYKCEKLKSNGDARKKFEIVYIYQGNIKMVNGEDYQCPHK